MTEPPTDRSIATFFSQARCHFVEASDRRTYRIASEAVADRVQGFAKLARRPRLGKQIELRVLGSRELSHAHAQESHRFSDLRRVPQRKRHFAYHAAVVGRRAQRLAAREQRIHGLLAVTADSRFTSPLRLAEFDLERDRVPDVAGPPQATRHLVR